MTRASTDPWRYLKSIEFDGIKGELERMEYPNYPDNCWTLDVAKQTNKTPKTPQKAIRLLMQKMHAKFTVAM